MLNVHSDISRYRSVQQKIVCAAVERNSRSRLFVCVHVHVCVRVFSPNFALTFCVPITCSFGLCDMHAAFMHRLVVLLLPVVPSPEK